MPHATCFGKLNNTILRRASRFKAVMALSALFNEWSKTAGKVRRFFAP